MKTSKIKIARALTVLGLTLLAGAGAYAQASFGQGLSIGEMARNGSNNAQGIYNLILDGAMLLGAALVAGGLWTINQSKKDEGRTKASNGWVAILVGAFMVAVPFVIASGQKTVAGDVTVRQNPGTIK